MRRLQVLRVSMLALFFLSGVSGLIYEIVWTRMLVLVFGNTLLATSTVLSAFMGGLAAGSFAAGRFIDARPRPLIKIYALLEAGIGAYALLFPILLGAAMPLYASLAHLLIDNIVLFDLLRFAVCFALISVPTFLMGATLPVLVKRFAATARSLGHEVAFLYGLNTVGAVTGTLACGYLLLRLLGMQATTGLAVGINLGVALIAALLVRLERPPTPADRTPADSATAPAPSAAARHPRAVRRAVLLGIGLSGYCALAYQVLWARMLNLFLNNNIYSFTAILATFLVGIALGSLLYSRFLAGIEHQVALFALLQVGIALLAFATPHTIGLLHESLFNVFNESLTLAKTAAIMLGPTLLMGISFPTAVQIVRRDPHREGSAVGTVYAVNTVGAIVGAFAGGFVLIPLLGLHRGLLSVVAVNLLAALLPQVARPTRHRRALWAGAWAAAVAALVLVSPAAPFRGLFQRSHPDAEILHYREGKVANVVVWDFPRLGHKDLFLNAVEEASSRLWHVQLFKLLGALPPLLHEDPEDALMIAFGAGMSAGACLDQVPSLDCVDLNPDIDGVAEVFRHENLDVINNPGLNRIVNDGRNALLLDPRRYSLIISDATNPKMFDSWTLYTREFYELVKSRLEPGGIFCQWFLIPLPGDAVPVILKTFRTVFPHMSLWCVYGSSQCLMLGTPERLELDYERLDRRLQSVLLSSGLAEYGIESTDKLLSFFLIGEDHLDRLLTDVQTISTDDLPHPQFQVHLGTAGLERSLDLVRFQEPVTRYLSNVGPREQEAVERIETYAEISRRLHLGFLTGREGRYREAAWLAAGRGLGADENIRSALGFDRERKRYFAARVASHPEDANAHNSLGYILLEEGDPVAAIGRFRRAVELAPEFATAHSNLARAYLAAGRLESAEAKLVELRSLNPTRRTLDWAHGQLRVVYRLRRLGHPGDPVALRSALGRTLFENGQLLESLNALRQAAEHDPDNEEILLNLAPLYERLELLDEAHDTYRRLARLLPRDPMVAAKSRIFSALTDDPARRDLWLAGRISAPDLDDRAPHQTTCDEALRLWNETPFEGSVPRDNLRRALDLYERSIATDPDDLHAYVDAATIAEALGDHHRAAALWRALSAAAEGPPGADLVARRLELLHVVEADGLPPAEASRALAEAGGLALVEGRVPLALELTRRSLRLAPGSVPLLHQLAEVLAASGRIPEAREARALAAAASG